MIFLPLSKHSPERAGPGGLSALDMAPDRVISVTGGCVQSPASCLGQAVILGQEGGGSLISAEITLSQPGWGQLEAPIALERDSISVPRPGAEGQAVLALISPLTLTFSNLPPTLPENQRCQTRRRSPRSMSSKWGSFNPFPFPLFPLSHCSIAWKCSRC